MVSVPGSIERNKTGRRSLTSRDEEVFREEICSKRRDAQDGAQKHEVAAQHSWVRVDMSWCIGQIYSYGYQDISVYIRKMMYRIAVKEPPEYVIPTVASAMYCGSSPRGETAKGRRKDRRG